MVPSSAHFLGKADWVNDYFTLLSGPIRSGVADCPPKTANHGMEMIVFSCQHTIIRLTLLRRHVDIRFVQSVRSAFVIESADRRSGPMSKKKTQGSIDNKGENNISLGESFFNTIIPAGTSNMILGKTFREYGNETLH